MVALLVILLPIVIYYSHGRRYDRVRPNTAQTEPPIEPPTTPDSDSSDSDSDSESQKIDSPLSDFKLFGFMDRPVVELLSAHVRSRQCKPGEIILEMDWEGRVDRSLYIVQSGQVELCVWSGDRSEDENAVVSAINDLADKRKDSKQITHLVGPGGTVSSLFSILSVFADCCGGRAKSETMDTTRKAVSATAVTDTTLTVIPEEAFIELAKTYPAEAAHITSVVLTRFQRVTFVSLYRYLGLAKELAAVERDINTEIFCTEISSEEASDEMLKELAVKTILKRLNLNSTLSESLTVSLLPMIMIHDYTGNNGIIEHAANCPGLVMVLSGSCHGMVNNTIISTTNRGGVCGTLAAFLGHSSFVDLVAGEEGAKVAILSRSGVQLLIKSHPQIMFGLAGRLLSRLSPLVKSIDLLVEWRHVKAGRPLFHKDDPFTSIMVVLHGRLWNHHKRLQYRQGDLIGASVWLVGAKHHRSTVIAQRDCELACLPCGLFDVMAQAFPTMAVNMARRFAIRAGSDDGDLISDDRKQGPKRRQDIRTVAIIPLTADDCEQSREFAESLCRTISRAHQEAAIILDSQSVIAALGRGAFSRMAKLRLYEYLNQQEDANRLVLLLGDANLRSVWTRQCCRQADTVLFVTEYTTDPDLVVSVGAEERRLVRSIKSQLLGAQKRELVFLHNSRLCQPGTTFKWLSPRPWIGMHHHVYMVSDGDCHNPDLQNIGLRNRVKRTLQFRPLTLPRASAVPTDDIGRVARHLLGKAVGVVLSGGGARGAAHVGVLRALCEAGIPVDVIGGTSMGAFVGALYASDADWLTLPSRIRYFCIRAGSIWRQLGDLTWPYCAWFTGHSLNRALWKLFGEWMIDDLWLPYFCVTTDISTSRKCVHRTGTRADDFVWRFVRASMSLSGLVPPVCDRHGHMHVDGGYVSTVPVEVLYDNADLDQMLQFNVGTVVVVDVSALIVDPGRFKIGDAVSGFWPALKRMVGVSTDVPNLAEIQTRIAFVSSDSANHHLRNLKDPSLFLIQPPVQHLSFLDFSSHATVSKMGYEEAKKQLDEWRREGRVLPTMYSGLDGEEEKRRRRSL